MSLKSFRNACSYGQQKARNIWHYQEMWLIAPGDVEQLKQSGPAIYLPDKCFIGSEVKKKLE